jgi:hypothetical protein
MDGQSNEFEKLQGQGAIAIWTDLSRDSQEVLFEAALSSTLMPEAGLQLFCTNAESGSSSKTMIPWAAAKGPHGRLSRGGDLRQPRWNESWHLRFESGL